jgi:hypothetical protein
MNARSSLVGIVTFWLCASTTGAAPLCRTERRVTLAPKPPAGEAVRASATHRADASITGSDPPCGFSSPRVEVWIEGLADAQCQDGAPMGGVCAGAGRWAVTAEAAQFRTGAPIWGRWTARANYWLALPDRSRQTLAGLTDHRRFGDSRQSGTGLATLIIFELDGRADVRLTSAADGVLFDLDADGVMDRVAWSLPDSNLAILAIDRNGNGSIDDGSEVFGNHTVKGATTGFAALEQFQVNDGSGALDSSDPLYHRLLLWVDRNHNGRSEREELSMAREVLAKVGLGYFGANKADENGNVIQYQGWAVAIADLRGGPDPPRPIYEVALARAGVK